MICCSKSISSNQANINQNVQPAPSLWQLKAAVITCLAFSILAAGIGGGLFQTGCWAYMCYGTAGAFLLGGLALLAISNCCCQSPKKTLEEKVELPREPQSTQIAIAPSVQPKQKTFEEELSELKEKLGTAIDKLPIIEKVKKGKYSKEELKADIEQIIKLYDLSTVDGQQKLKEHLNAYHDSLASHFSSEYTCSNYAPVGIENPLPGNNGYILVGLQILAHTSAGDFLFQRPDISEEKAKGFKLPNFKEQRPQSPSQSKLSPSLKTSFVDPASNINSARTTLWEAVSNLRKGETVSKEQIQSIYRKITYLVANKQHIMQATTGSAKYVLNLIFQFFSDEEHFFKITPIKNSQASKATIIVGISERKDRMWVYVKKEDGWYSIENEKVEKVQPQKFEGKLHAVEYVTKQVETKPKKPSTKKTGGLAKKTAVKKNKNQH